MRAAVLRSRLWRRGWLALVAVLRRAASPVGPTTALVVAALACAVVPPVAGSARAAADAKGPPPPSDVGTGRIGPDLPVPVRPSATTLSGPGPAPTPEIAHTGAGAAAPGAELPVPPAPRAAGAAVQAPEPAPARWAAAVPSAQRVPLGKGMWLYQLSQTAGAAAVVRQAQAVGLTHLYLRLGSSKDGFYDQGELDQLLPAAHAGGLKVVGWDFPYLDDPGADAQRAADEIAYTTADGQRIDAFSADVETAAEGVHLSAAGAAAYGARLRELAGPGYPLIATVPRPATNVGYPFAEVTASFDAIAPMVYWLNRDPVAEVTAAIADLAPFGKPVLPIGQAYDGGPEGGPPGKPAKEAVVRFMDAAVANGALGVSFWAFHDLTAEHWAAVGEATAWDLPADAAAGDATGYLRRVLAVAGYPITGGPAGPATTTALTAAQHGFGLPATGTLDRATARDLLGARR